MNNLQFQFGSRTPIGDQEKVIIKKLQAKVNEVLNNEGDKAYDEYANLSISVPFSELSEVCKRRKKADEIVTYLLGFEKITEEYDREGHLGTLHRYLFDSIRVANKKKVLIFTINRTVVESVFLSDK